MSLHEDLKAFIDDELSPVRAAEVQAAIDQDPVLREEYLFMKNLSGDIQTSAREPQAKGLDATLGKVTRPRSTWPFAKIAGWSAAGVSAVFILGIVFFPVYAQSEEAAKSTLARTSSMAGSPPVADFDTAKSSVDGRETTRGGGSALEERGIVGGNVDRTRYQAPMESEPSVSKSKSTIDKFENQGSAYVPVRPGSATIRNRDVIRTANMGLKVKDVSKAMSETETQVAAMGGFVENTNFNQESDASRGTMNFQVPEKNFDAIVEYLGKAGTIVNNNKTGTDVTGEIAYTDGRIVSLADEELNLIKELQRTRNSTDRLEIRRRLSYVRQEIRGLKEQNKATKDLADMSRFVVSFEKSTQFDNASPDDWFGQTTQGAGNVLGFFGRIFGVGLIYTLYLAPIWLPIVGVVWWLRRRAKIGSV